MILQASRYLKKLRKKGIKGEKLPEPFGYLNDLVKKMELKGRIGCLDDMLNLDML